MDMFDKKLIEYKEHFNEGFPTQMVRGLDENEIIELIDKSIASNTPYEVPLQDGVNY